MMISRIPLERIFDNPFQTRTNYTEIEELAQSIFKMREAKPETSGLMQIPSARAVMANGKGWKILNPDEYGGIETMLDDEPLALVQLAFGHRRLRAFHGLAGEVNEYSTFPVEVLPLSDEQMADLAWEENEKRKDLTAIEEALALQQAIDLFGYTQAQIGERWGLSQSAVANKLRLLQLPQEAQEVIRRGELSEKHGRALLTAMGKSQRIYKEAARDILPPVVKEGARDTAASIYKGLDWYETRRAPEGIHRVECAACGALLFQPAQGVDEPFWRANDPNKPSGPQIGPPFWALCIPCYRVASGWTPPATAEAEAIVKRSYSLNSNRLGKVEWPMDRTFESPVEGKAMMRVLPACEGCPAREERDKEPWCLDRTCFELKKKLWEQELFTMARNNLARDYGEVGETVQIVSGWGGQDLSKHSVDPDLIKNGVCVPGKCKRLRLKYANYISSSDIKPYDDLPFVWNCDNSNAHSACQRRYLASQATEEEKSAERKSAELANQRKIEAKALAERAAKALTRGLDEDKLEVWRGLVNVIEYGKGDKLETVTACKKRIAEKILSDIFSQLGYRDWNQNEAMSRFEASLNKEMAKLGVSLPADAEDIRRKLERIYEFVTGSRIAGTITAVQIEGNRVNLKKLEEEVKRMELGEEERRQLFNQINEVNDELGSEGAEEQRGIQQGGEGAVENISQEMVGETTIIYEPEPGLMIDPAGEIVKQAMSVYSGDALSQDRARGLIQIDGNWYVCRGRINGGLDNTEEVHLTKAIPLADHSGPTSTYRELVERENFTYAGQRITCKGKEWVLTGEGLIVRYEPAEALTPSPTLPLPGGGS